MAEKIKLNGSQYILRILELLEFDTVFGYPGGAVLPLYDEINRSQLRTILVRHEQGAAFAACAYGKVKGKPGVVLATSGPGATNLVTGLADAYMDSSPMIAITGQVPNGMIGSDAFQETDVTGVCMPVTKKTFLLTDVTKAEDVLREAYEVSMNGRRGPVLVDIPKDVQAIEIMINADWESRFRKPRLTRTYNALDIDLEQGADAIRNAKRPLILAGHGLFNAHAVKELRNFTEREQIPVVTTILGKGALEFKDPLNFDWLGMHGMKYANLAVQEADLIIGMGIRFDDRITGRLDDFAPKAKILHIDIDKSENSKNVKADVFIQADLKIALSLMPDCSTPANLKDRAEWFKYLDDLRKKYPLKKADHKVFGQVTALDVLNQYLDDDAFVTTDVGQHQMWAGQYLDVKANRFVTSGGLGAMGFGLPAALGVQVAFPKKQTWCITGDGSFQMNFQELMTLTQEAIPVKTIVLDNAYLGMVRQWQEQFYARNYSGVNMLNPDFKLLAEACGVKSIMVDNADDLSAAIKEAIEHPGPYLIHAKVVKEELVLPMVPPNISLSDTIYYDDVEQQKEPLKNVAKPKPIVKDDDDQQPTTNDKDQALENKVQQHA